MLETPFSLFPDTERIRHLYPRLEQSVRSLETHLRGYQTAGRQFQRLFLAIFPPGFELGTDPGLAPIRKHLEELRQLIIEGHFPNEAIEVLDSNISMAASICLILSLLQHGDTLVRPSLPINGPTATAP